MACNFSFVQIIFEKKNHNNKMVVFLLYEILLFHDNRCGKFADDYNVHHKVWEFVCGKKVHMTNFLFSPICLHGLRSFVKFVEPEFFVIATPTLGTYQYDLICVISSEPSTSKFFSRKN